jgi:site-specific recombinase XerD
MRQGLARTWVVNFYLSDSSFCVGGQSYVGFPILVDARGRIVEVALLFFVAELIGKPGARDLKTWEAYGRHLYDFFGYIEAKKLKWEHIPGPMSGDVSPLAHYITWCDSAVGNEPGYINDKVGTIMRFYRWALKVGLVDTLPFTDIEVVSSHRGGMQAHASDNAGKQASTDMRLHEPKKHIMVLSRGQIDVALRLAKNPTHRAMLHLGLNAGLRAEELVSFPAKYVVDCRKLSEKIRSVPVVLSPRDMDTKNDTTRTVRVSVQCMNLLWQYREVVRPSLHEKSSTSTSDSLFRTRYGIPFVADGLVAPMARLGKRLGFHIHPHMLRHTFATHTLASLEDLKRAGRLKSSPIVVLMNLLGHSSIVTTSRYLHLLDSIDDVYGTQYQKEIDLLVHGYLKEQAA